MAAAALWACGVASAAAGGNGDWWRTYPDAEFVDSKSYDGDSFHLRVKSGTRRYDWVIRLYGVDCPETDNRFPDRNAEQAKHFGVAPNRIPTLGKSAKRQAWSWFRAAKEIRLHVRAKGKEKTRRSAGQGQRYYGIVELIQADGSSVLLHERLLEEGLARAFGMPAPWPPKTENRQGEPKAEEDFERKLKQLEHKAKREKSGIWSKKRP